MTTYHWRSAHDSFVSDDVNYDPKKALKKALLEVKLAMLLSDCDLYMWPYSAYMKWKLKIAHRRKITELDKDGILDVELDNMKAKLDESMKNIDIIQRSKEDSNGIHNVRNA